MLGMNRNQVTTIGNFRVMRGWWSHFPFPISQEVIICFFVKLYMKYYPYIMTNIKIVS